MAEIKFDTPSAGVFDKLIKSLRAKEKQIQAENIKRVTAYGAEYAKEQLRGYLGRESDVVEGIYGEVNPQGNEGKVVASHPASPYVEYGTGTVGMWSPHPTGPAPGGYRIGAWPFEHSPYGPGIFWTRGQVSKPFMYNTYMHLKDKFGK